MREKEEVPIDQLLAFLIKAKRDGYASGEATTVEEPDGSHSTRVKDGDFEFHDNWFGGEPFGGREVVLYKGEPYWMMVYYGSNNGDKEIVEFLRKALGQMPQDFPARGPMLLEEGELKYQNQWTGDIHSFSGEEKIMSGNVETYSAKYQGGLVDQREG